MFGKLGKFQCSYDGKIVHKIPQKLTLRWDFDTGTIMAGKADFEVKHSHMQNIMGNTVLSMG